MGKCAAEHLQELPQLGPEKKIILDSELTLKELTTAVDRLPKNKHFVATAYADDVSIFIHGQDNVQGLVHSLYV